MHYCYDSFDKNISLLNTILLIRPCIELYASHQIDIKLVYLSNESEWLLCFSFVVYFNPRKRIVPFLKILISEILQWMPFLLLSFTKSIFLSLVDRSDKRVPLVHPCAKPVGIERERPNNIVWDWVDTKEKETIVWWKDSPYWNGKSSSTIPRSKPSPDEIMKIQTYQNSHMENTEIIITTFPVLQFQ